MLQYLIGSSPGTVTKDKIFAEHWNTKIQSPLKVATVIQSVATNRENIEGSVFDQREYG